MSEGHVYLCQSQKTNNGFRVWLQKRPGICAEGETISDALEELSSAVCLALGDGEAVFDLIPPNADGEFIALVWNSFWSPPATFTRADYAALYEGGLCDTCCTGIGPRTSKPLPVGTLSEGDLLGSRLRLPKVLLASDRFRRLLNQREERKIEWVPVAVHGRSRRTFFEVRPKFSIKAVADRTCKVSGWHCPACGHRVFSVDYVNEYVAASDLPARKPDLLLIDDPHLLKLAIPLSRWKEIRGKPGTKGILTSNVVQLPTKRVWKRPDLKDLTKSQSAAINRELQQGLHTASRV
jgi:hypothetical protein